MVVRLIEKKQTIIMTKMLIFFFYSDTDSWCCTMCREIEDKPASPDQENGNGSGNGNDRKRRASSGLTTRERKVSFDLSLFLVWMCRWEFEIGPIQKPTF